jgi:16S rRNA (adenine(1408)-N(1))-methyltransferase
VDLGSGDGKAVLVRAAREPGALVVGLDAVADGLARASRRAARPPRKGGRPNAVFALASAAAPPPDLLRRADELTIQFPWGSLLRGTLALEADVARGVAALLAPGGRVIALLAPASRDRLGGVPTADQLLDGEDAGLAERWAAMGLELVEMREATAGEVSSAASSWARRLGAERGARRVVRLELRAGPGGRGGGAR